MNEEEVYKIHESIGFPLISEKDQAEMLISRNVEIINKLTPDYKATYIPSSVGNRYITLSKNKFRQYFNDGEFIRKSFLRHLENPDLECCWVEKTKDNNYNYLCSERGVGQCRATFENYDDLIDNLIDMLYEFYDHKQQKNGNFN